MPTPQSHSVFSSLLQLWQYRRLIRKYGLGQLFTELELPSRFRFIIKLLLGGKSSIDASRAVRIRLCLQELGPVFIKLGQALSTRPDLLPDDIAKELAKLQDQVQPFSGELALKMIHQQYGDATNDIFKTIDPTPLASASIAQVHCATLQANLAIAGKNGLSNDEVIIKVLRPNVHELIAKDLNLLRTLSSALDKTWRRASQFKPKSIVTEFETTMLGELDLRLEAANCSQMAGNFAGNDIIYVPTVYWDYTYPSIMVMERIYGTPVRDMQTLIAKGYDLKQLASDGVTTFFKQAFDDNFFHADMHPGNIFVSERGKWIAIDFGIMGVLTDQDKHYLAIMLLSFFNRDYSTIALTHQRAGWISSQASLTEFESAIRMVCEPNFAKPISEISFGRVLMELFQTVQRFEMPVQPQLVLLYKTLMQVEGLGRQLYPQLNLWDTAKPFLENWMKEQLSPKTLLSEFHRDWPVWQSVIKDLPHFIQSTIITRNLHADDQSVPLKLSFFHICIALIVTTACITTLIFSLFISIESISQSTQIGLGIMTFFSSLWLFKHSRHL